MTQSVFIYTNGANMGWWRVAGKRVWLYIVFFRNSLLVVYHMQHVDSQVTCSVNMEDYIGEFLSQV